MPLDSNGIYGLTKGFGERICQYFCREFDMNIVALRITGPRTREQWTAERRSWGEATHTASGRADAGGLGRSGVHGLRGPGPLPQGRGQDRVRTVR